MEIQVPRPPPKKRSRPSLYRRLKRLEAKVESQDMWLTEALAKQQYYEAVFDALVRGNIVANVDMKCELDETPF